MPTPHIIRSLGFAIVLFAVLVLLQHHKSYTADEVYELRNLSSNWQEVSSRPDGFPPLYTWLFGQFTQLFSESNARLFSTLTASIGLLFVFATGKTLGGTVGTRAALFYAASACQLEYAQQARAYSLYICLGAFVLWSAVQTVYRQRVRDWALLVISSVAILWTHYFSATFLVAVWLGVAVVGGLVVTGNQQGRSRFIRHFALSVVASAIALIPWFRPLLVDLRNPPPIEAINPVDLTGIAYTYLTMVQGWCFGPSQIELFEWSKSQAIVAVAPWAMFSALLFLALSLRAILGRNASDQIETGVVANLEIRNSRATSIWMATIIVGTPIFAASLAAILNSSFVGRYMAVLVVPFSLLCGLGSNFRKPSWTTLASYGLIAINLVSFAGRNFLDRYDRENYRRLVSILEQHDSPQLLVLSNYLGNAIQYHADSGIQIAIVGLNSDEVDNWNKVRSQNAWLSAENSHLWVATDWMRPDDLRILKRDKILSELGAKHVMRVSGTLELFSVADRSTLVSP